MSNADTPNIGDHRGDRQTAACLRVSVRQAESADAFNEVELEGNREGLIWLANKILEIANASKDQHTHLDRNCNSPIYHSTKNWWLTISKSGR